MSTHLLTMLHPWFYADGSAGSPEAVALRIWRAAGDIDVSKVHSVCATSILFFLLTVSRGPTVFDMRDFKGVWSAHCTTAKYKVVDRSFFTDGCSTDQGSFFLYFDNSLAGTFNTKRISSMATMSTGVTKLSVKSPSNLGLDGFGGSWRFSRRQR